MKNTIKPQKGQALVLIAVGMVALIGFTALAVDGGNVFAERRRSQNAADTSSMAAALEKTDDTYLTPGGTVITADDGDGINWYQAGINLVEENKYNLDPSTNTVTLVNPPGADCKGATNGPYFGNQDYIQVLIHITVKTFFAPVVGIPQVQSCVEAIAYAKPPYSTILYNGNSIVALAPHECKAVKYQGTADTVLTLGGVFVNSDCENSAFFNNSCSAVLIAPSLTSVGGNNYKDCALDIPSISSGATQLPYPPDFTLPKPELDCDLQGPGTQDGEVITPGNWYGEFPPNNVTYMEPGLYCVYAGNKSFNIRNSDTLNGTGVTIAVMTGGISWTGSDLGIHLSAPAPTIADCEANPLSIPCKYNGLLIFMPMTNSSAVVFNGNSNWDITGTILAPAAPITINGTEDGFSMSAQIIGYTVDISGTGSLNLTYNANDNWDGPYPPHIELTK